MEETFIQYPFIFGLIAAIIHVLSGPDHLAAVGPLALSDKLKAWIVGFSWAIGHITGMMIIGVLFIFFKEYIPIEVISSHSEKLVGVMLILIGLWALFRLWKLNIETQHKHVHMHVSGQGEAYIHKHEHRHEESKIVHEHIHSEGKNQTYFAALGIGILHGLAGVSHFLGILPTLAYDTWIKSAFYLTGFSMGTIVAMVSFSFILGMLSKYATEKKKITITKLINGIAGFAALLVGIIWLIQN
jgi:ABC-type nickel/cobalt efflux system permease component RcnA